MKTQVSIKRLGAFIAGLFLLILWLPTLCALLGIHPGKTIDEYRNLAALPRLDSETANNLEQYYNDHFGGRECLITCRLSIERKLFPEQADGILTGQDGWLYALGENMLNNFLGVSTLTHRQLQAWQAELENRRDKLAARGVKYLFVVTPNKESVYPGFLPQWLQDHSAATKTDQFVNYMRLHSTVKILDLRPVLKNAGTNYALFYKTDTHWNLMGAYVGCEAIVSNLADQVPELTPLPLTDFSAFRTNGRGGDIARMAGWLTLPEDNLYVVRPGHELAMPRYYGPTNQIEAMRFGTLPVLEFASIAATNSQRSVRAVMFGDSYTFQLAPFLGCHFGETVIFRRDFNFKDIDTINPDVVIDEKVERWLYAAFRHGRQ